MLNIEVIRFEAQDVITASVAAPVVPDHFDMADCVNPDGHAGVVTTDNGVIRFVCKHCGQDVSASGSIQG